MEGVVLKIMVTEHVHTQLFKQLESKIVELGHSQPKLVARLAGFVEALKQRSAAGAVSHDDPRLARTREKLDLIHQRLLLFADTIDSKWRPLFNW
jgi:hypothetical protein